MVKVRVITLVRMTVLRGAQQQFLGFLYSIPGWHVSAAAQRIEAASTAKSKVAKARTI
jgi:hypothetical protein